MAELPKQDLLVKLLNMTTSDAESEVLMAIRRANVLLREAGWSWDMLIHEKIKIVENPFKNLGDPIATRQRDNPSRPAAPQQPTWRPSPPPPPPQNLFTYHSQAIGGVRNNFGGHCWHCGWYQNAGDGFWFTPNSFNRSAPHGREVICTTCDSHLDGTTGINNYAHSHRGKPKMGPAASQPIPQSTRAKTRRGGSTPIYKPGVGEL